MIKISNNEKRLGIMRKYMLIFGLIFILVIISGCSSDKILDEPVTNNESEVSETDESGKGDKTSTQDEQTKKTVEYKVNVDTLDNLPEYFVLRDFIDDTHFLGETTEGTFIYSIEDEQYKIISNERYWDYLLSPNKEQLLLTSEGPVVLLDLQTGDKIKEFDLGIYECEGCDSFGLNWGTDSTLILTESYEWSAKHYTINKETAEREYLDINLDGYFSQRYIKGLDDNRLLFSARANTKQDGTSGEYTHGYREDMAIYNLTTKEFTKITNANDGEFYSLISAKDNFLYLNKSIIMGQESIIEYYKLDLGTGELDKLDLEMGKHHSNYQNNGILTFIDEENYIFIDSLEATEGFTMYHVKGQKKYEIATWYKEYSDSYVEVYPLSNKVYILYNSEIYYYPINY